MLSCAMLQRQGWSSTGHTGRFFFFFRFIARGRGVVTVARKKASGVLSCSRQRGSRVLWSWCRETLTAFVPESRQVGGSLKDQQSTGREEEGLEKKELTIKREQEGEKKASKAWKGRGGVR